MSIAGDLITEALDYDGGREVTVYVPPEPPEAVVFAGCRPAVLRYAVFRRAESSRSPSGVRYPDLYGAIFCASPGGGYRAPDVVPTSMHFPQMVAWAFG